MEKETRTRIIEVKSPIGLHEPRGKTIRPRKLSDYPDVLPVYLEVVRKLSSPFMNGPPICDELIAFVCHLLTEEEADLVSHLGQFSAKSAADLAKAVHRPLAEVEPILRRLTTEKNCIASSGPEDRKLYKLMPIFPGIYEMVLIGQTPESLTDWHRRFAELFEALYETGYFLEYDQVRPTPFIRFLPVRSAIEAHPMALPTDKLEVVLDRFDVFGMGQCQCRLSMQVLGKGCGKPLGNCTVMGEMAKTGIRDGWLRKVSKEEILEIKLEAEASGLVNWIINAESSKSQASCSCCGCCCHAMRLMSEFNAPSIMAPPHFIPRFDSDKCTYCGKCAQNCPMAALTIDPREKSRRHLIKRCIGCGLCKVACDKKGAISMEPVPDYRLPYRSSFSLMARATPKMLKAGWDVWRKRRQL